MSILTPADRAFLRLGHPNLDTYPPERLQRLAEAMAASRAMQEKVAREDAARAAAWARDEIELRTPVIASAVRRRAVVAALTVVYLAAPVVAVASLFGPLLVAVVGFPGSGLAGMFAHGYLHTIAEHQRRFEEHEARRLARGGVNENAATRDLS